MNILAFLIPLFLAGWVCYSISNLVRAGLIKAGSRYYDLFSILTFIVCFILMIAVLLAMAVMAFRWEG
jgi:hypothetical protein